MLCDLGRMFNLSEPLFPHHVMMKQGDKFLLKPRLLGRLPRPLNPAPALPHNILYNL